MNKKFAKLKGAPDEITAVTTSLNALVKEGGDMRAEFKAFDKDVNNLISLQDRFRKLKTNLNSSKSALIGTWAERQFTINNDELRARSRERRSAVIARFNEVNELVNETKAEFDPWLQEVIDIRTYLESDLNPGGVASIADVAPQISKKARPVKSKIANLIAELDKLSNEMTATWSSNSGDK
jgi:uncharacterized coiled-coil DUF342 family protein